MLIVNIMINFIQYGVRYNNSITVVKGIIRLFDRFNVDTPTTRLVHYKDPLFGLNDIPILKCCQVPPTSCWH